MGRGMKGEESQNWSDGGQRDIAKGSCRSRSIRKGSAMHTSQIRFV